MTSKEAMRILRLQKREQLAEFLCVDIKKIYNWDQRGGLPAFLAAMIRNYAVERELKEEALERYNHLEEKYIKNMGAVKRVAEEIEPWEQAIYDTFPFPDVKKAL